jgi:peroxiredoxin Q/BCP
LSDFSRKKKVIYFYPKALTPGCTMQSKALRDVYEELSELGCDVIGVSPDKPEKQKRFDDKHSLGFTLLCDTEKEVAQAF